MATLPKPNKPLKILTIDGGTLEVGSKLIFLQRLLDASARNNGVPDSKPRPCDVFDVIAGIGSGGWLALLLGRFQMDTLAAMTEWYNLICCIVPRSKAEELRMLLLQHSYYHTERLVEQIDELTEVYQTDKHMFFTPPEGSRCKHVFVSALKTDSKDRQLKYNLFRTYDCPKGANVLEASQNPHEYKISHAFQATAAAKYFTPPWKEPTAKRGISKCLDIEFPSPHNITEIALNEMWGLYGKDVEIFIVVNIGVGEKLRRDKSKIESDIREKLRNVYPEHTPPYYRLFSAPDRSAPGTSRKYTSPLKASLDYTKEYVRTRSVQIAMEEVGQRIDLGTSELEMI